MQQHRAKQRFLHTPAEEMPDASALWNLNRQLSFFAGSALLALLLRVFPPAYAWQGVFISAAVHYPVAAAVLPAAE
ncbi:major facilitator family transporter [Klebsiella pneumoniae]|uniref:Major facilitator family transporter n=1 Tax=Klebsiella pneumoniae TaxID=573 RepID=A0A2X3ESX6_KLEPN|nr:major facilitator family transporter [Klebsiella pneumoniae]